MSITPLSPQEVRAFRKSMGWTQEQMASELGVAKRTVEGWENREVDPADPTKGAPPLYLRSAMAAMIYGMEPWAPGVEAARKVVEIALLDVDAEHRLAGPVKPSGVPVGPAASAPGSRLKKR